MKKLKLGKAGKTTVFFDLSNAYNKHITLLGKSGAGKSVAAQKVLIELAKANEEGSKMNTVIAFNTHGCLDDREIFTSIKPEFDALSKRINVKNGGLTCHLFECLKNEDGSSESSIDTVMAVNNSLAKVFKLGSRQKVSLRRAIEKTMEAGTYNEKGIRAVGEYLRMENTPTAEGVYDKLFCLFGHNLFVDGDLFLDKGAINVVDMKHLDGDTQIIVIELVLSFFWRLAMAGQLEEYGEIYIFIDEVQNISFASGGMLSLLLSEGRKFHLNLILATQLLNYNSTNPTQRKMLQAGLVLYFKPADNDRATTASMISEIEKERWSMELSVLGVGEFVASGPLLVNTVSSSGPIIVSGREDTEKRNPTIKIIQKVLKAPNPSPSQSQSESPSPNLSQNTNKVETKPEENPEA